jgi:hypothetical protein
MTIVEMYKKVLVLSDKDVESYVHMMINKEGIILDYLKHYAEHYYLYAKSLYCSWFKVSDVFFLIFIINNYLILF